MTVELNVCILVGRFSNYWRHTRTRLEKSTKRLQLCANLTRLWKITQNMMPFKIINLHNETNVRSIPDVYMQKYLCIYENVVRGTRNGQTQNRREEISVELQDGGSKWVQIIIKFNYWLGLEVFYLSCSHRLSTNVLKFDLFYFIFGLPNINLAYFISEGSVF